MTKEDVFNANRGLVHHIAGRYKCDEDLYDDMIQAGYEGLWKSCLKLDAYDSEKGTLSTYLGRYIQLELSRFVFKNRNRSGLSVPDEVIRKTMKKPDSEWNTAQRRAFTTATSIDKPIDDEGTTIGDMRSTDDELYDGLTDELDKLLDTLPSSEQTLVRRYYGFGMPKETLHALADEFGVSRQTMSYRVNKALDQLRKVPGSSALAAYL